jgi:hypothetical protein
VAGETKRVAIQVSSRTCRIGAINLRPLADRQDAPKPYAFVTDAPADRFRAQGQLAEPGHRLVRERIAGVRDVDDALRAFVPVNNDGDSAIVSFLRMRVVGVLQQLEQEPPYVLMRRVGRRGPQLRCRRPDLGTSELV